MSNTSSQEMSLDDAYNVAVKHMNAQNFRVAELALRDILASVPDHHDSMYLLGMALYNTGNRDEAISWLEKAVTGEKPRLEWMSDLGVIQNEAGRSEQAINTFDKGLEIYPGDAKLLWNKSYALWLLGRYEESETAGRAATEADPKSAEAWLNLGAAIVKLGRREEAVECWEKALKIEPNFAFAWNNMGTVLRELGDLEKSEEACRKALELHPNYVEANCNLGNVYLDRGDFAEAEKYYRAAIAYKPDYADAHNNLCVSLMYQLRFDEAAMHGRYATSFNPRYTEAYINLSEALRNLGMVDDARRAVEQAVILRPESPEVRMDLADVLLMQDKYNDAEIELKKVVDITSENPRTYLKLANVQERAGRVDEALEAVAKAIELNPELPEAYLRRGQINQISNRIQEAEDSLNKALELRPNHPTVLMAMAELLISKGDLKGAEEYATLAKTNAPDLPSLYLTLSHLKKFTKEDADFKKMLELEQNIEARGIDQASVLNFALYKAHEDIGEYEKAFEHLKKGNDYKRRLIPYDSKMQGNVRKSIETAYSKEKLRSYEGKGYESDIPVLIVGMPRSGTTLTEQIISSHPDVYGAGELTVLSTLEKNHGLLDQDNAKELGKAYVDAVKELDETDKMKRITDKMPGNYAHIGLITSILPNAKIIHCRRDPIDTCLSCYKQNFARGQYWSYNLEELAAQHKLYQEVMAYWREVLPGRFLEIDYEETVNNFEEQARKLIDYVGLPWDDACLSPHKQKRAVLTASKTQVIKPVYKTSVKAWKRYEEQLQPLIKGLGL